MKKLLCILAIIGFASSALAKEVDFCTGKNLTGAMERINCGTSGQTTIEKMYKNGWELKDMEHIWIPPVSSRYVYIIFEK